MQRYSIFCTFVKNNTNKMKKNILSIAFIAFGLSASAQTMQELILKMPQSVCPLLSEYNKLEIVDNQQNNKPMKTKNMLQSTSEMLEMTNDYARLMLSESSEKVMKLLKRNEGDSIIMVISTIYCEKIPDSSVEFYTADWKKLEAKEYFSEPISTEFREITIVKESNKVTIVESNPLEVQTDGSENQIEMKRREKVLEWNGERFVGN